METPQGDMSYFGNVSDDSESSSDTDVHEKGVVGMVNATTGVGHAPTPDFYDPKKYESLEVPDDVKEMFENINRYTPQKIELEYRLKPFIPRFIPAVGDIDALLKVVPPPSWDPTQDLPKVINILGLEILDEPSGIQSEPALLHMKLRATSTAPRTPGPPVALAKNHKDVNKWINDIETLHSSQPAPTVTYNRPMPDTDNLMQEWSGPVERSLDENGFPEPMIDGTLSQYASMVCNLLDIPIPAPHGHKERLLALHSLFTLYTAVRNSNIVN